MDDAATLALADRLLVHLGLGPAPRRLITTGWDARVVEVDGRLMFRFPRDAAARRTMEAESRLLPALATRVTFAVPAPEWSGTFEGEFYMGYRRVPGRAFAAGDDIRSAGTVLRELHAFPVSEAVALLGGAANLAAWVAGYAHLRAAADEALRSLEVDAPPATVAALAAGFDALAATDWRQVEPALVHNDLNPEHILVDPATGRTNGLIDFGDACIGDPQIDLVGFFTRFGADTCTGIARHAGLEPAWRRLRLYAAMVPVHDLLHAHRLRDDTMVERALDSLAARLADLNRGIRPR